MRILIAGIGNKLRGDDGYGPRVVEELSKMNLPKHVEAIDYGISSMKALLDLKDYDAVIFIDAIDMGGKPGEIFIIKPSIDEMEKIAEMSLHEIDLNKILAMAKTLNTLPRKIIVIGCQPKNLSNKLRLSREVERAVRRTVKMVLEILENELLRDVDER